MAIIAPDADLPEFPAVAFPVTVETGSGLVGSVKDKRGMVVLFDGEKGGGESLFVMALRAVGYGGSGSKLFPVVIRMAVGAAEVLQSARIPVLVAGGAGDRFVFSFQWKSGGRMVKVPGVLDLVEGDFGMALDAVLSEPVLMHVPVATHTAFMGNPPEHLDLLSIHGCIPVAFGTIHCLVFSKKPETGVTVVEPGCRTEFVVTMAGGALRTQRPLVEIVMAIRTLLSEPQESTCPFPEIPVPDEFFFMALAAINPAVGSLKRIPCQGVIKLLLVESDQLKIPAVVVVVARSTFLAFDFGRNMIAHVVIDPGCNLLMAVQALLVGNLFPQDVAFDAVGHPFQVGMGFCKVPRT